MKTFFLSLCCLSVTLFVNGQSVSLDSETKAALKSELDSIYTEDQKYRLKMDSVASRYGYESEMMNKLFDITEEKDSLNQIRVKQILDKYGWLGPDEVGERASSTLFLVIQHADQKTQEKYLPMLRDAVKNGKAKSRNLAMMEDRVALSQGRKQIYGTQIMRNHKTGIFYVAPIEDEANVNKRRAAVGLQPLEEYVKHWNIDYKLPKE